MQSAQLYLGLLQHTVDDHRLRFDTSGVAGLQMRFLARTAGMAARITECLPWPRPPAEDVGIVLLESAHTRQPLQGPAVLIAVQDAKVREAQGELSVAACAIGKHETVPCRGESKWLALSRLCAQLSSIGQGSFKAIQAIGKLDHPTPSEAHLGSSWA